LPGIMRFLGRSPLDGPSRPFKPMGKFRLHRLVHAGEWSARVVTGARRPADSERGDAPAAGAVAHGRQRAINAIYRPRPSRNARIYDVRSDNLQILRART